MIILIIFMTQTLIAAYQIDMAATSTTTDHTVRRATTIGCQYSLHLLGASSVVTDTDK